VTETLPDKSPEKIEALPAAKPNRLARLAKGNVVGSLASMVDQGAAAAISFAASVVIGRYAGLEALGVYAVTNVLLLFIRSLYTSLLLEPMSVFGPRQPPERAAAYRGFTIGLHFAWMTILTILAVLLLLAYVQVDPLDDQIYFAMLAALGYGNIITVQEFIRRHFYLEQQPFSALLQSVSYLVLTAIGLVALRAYGEISVLNVYGVLAVCSFIVCAMQLYRFATGLGKPTLSQVRLMLRDHWIYGRWLILGNPLTLLGRQGYLLMAAAMLSITDTGYLKAADTLIQPLMQVSIGLSLFLLPISSRKVDHLSIAKQRSLTLKNLIPMGAIGAVYCALVIVFGADILLLLFGEKVAPAAELLPLMAFISLAVMIEIPAGVTLASLMRSDLRLLGEFITAIATLVLGVLLLMFFGLWGAAIGMLVSRTLMAAIRWKSLQWAWGRLARTQTAAPSVAE
jgi:O-antigen/teichoic acid export membrane protein